MAIAGSAVGLGNMWRFPHYAAENGGGAFIFVYLVILLVICIPIFITEITLGRKARSNVTRVYSRLGAKQMRWAGFIPLFTALIMMSFYIVVGGWSVKYLFQALSMNYVDSTADYAGAFGTFISSTWEPLIFTVIFVLLTATANFGGVKNGIEKFSKPMMMVLSSTIILLAIRSITLPGAWDGVRYLLVPHFDKIDGKVLISALGQSFMSLSIGAGALFTYGSYIDTKEDITTTAVTTGLIDTMFAIIAGLAIIPAVYAIAYMNGVNPDVNAGPGLVFITLPSVFASMPGGSIIAILFFMSLLIAAITSAMSLIEVISLYLIEEWNMTRPLAVITSQGVIMVLGCICSLSQGPLAQVKVFGLNLFDLCDTTSSNFMMTIGSLVMVIFAGWFMDKSNFMDELTSHGGTKAPAWVLRYLWFAIRWIAPIVIIAIILSNFLL